MSSSLPFYFTTLEVALKCCPLTHLWVFDVSIIVATTAANRRFVFFDLLEMFIYTKSLVTIVYDIDDQHKLIVYGMPYFKENIKESNAFGLQRITENVKN